MQSILNLHGSYGLPLCLSGITHPLSLSTEIADHDRRRESMKKKRKEARGIMHSNGDKGRNHERELRLLEEEIRERADIDEVHGDLVGLFHDLISMFLASPAKAA
ncbi:hypothetical protein U1Q18_033112 [Sarracenia purpurea var. burkii]